DALDDAHTTSPAQIKPGTAAGPARPAAAKPATLPLCHQGAHDPRPSMNAGDGVTRAVVADTADADCADVVEAAGHFRIYLGAVAGVGKTYALLCEGQRRRERGADVVVAFVECHQRQHTEEL